MCSRYKAERWINVVPDAIHLVLQNNLLKTATFANRVIIPGNAKSIIPFARN